MSATTKPAGTTRRGTPYERIIEWVAGPTAILAGALATWLDNHFGLLGKSGLGQDQTAKAIFDCVTFGVGALLTYGAHSKWLSNVPKWWEAQAANQANAGQIPPTTTDPTSSP